MRETILKVFIVSLISLMTACAAQTKDALLPQTGPTMEDVYRNHEQNLSSGSTGSNYDHKDIKERMIGNYDADLAGYTRQANTEIQQSFPRLPNPTLVMYVYPHLSTSSGLPVPGYSTAFPLYERPEYALPGEM